MTFEQSLIGRDNTLKTQLCLLRKWIKPYINEAACKTITQYDCMIIAQYVWKKEHKLSNNTIIALLSLMHRYITYYGGNVDFKPIKKLMRESVTDNTSTPKSLTKTEFAQLLLACSDRTQKAIILCGLHAGLRKGEVFGLEAQDVHPEHGWLSVKRSYDGPTKSGKPRTVPLTTGLFNELDHQIWLGHLKPTDRIFKPTDPNVFLKKLCFKAKIRPITFHSLRHSCATNLLNKGCSIKDVQTILGHAKPSTTIDIYWSSIGGNVNMNDYF